MQIHNKVLIIASVVLLSIVTPARASMTKPETAATLEYSWNLVVGDTLIWNMTLQNNSYYVKHVVADFNSTSTGTWWAEVLWTRQYAWNRSTHMWDFLYPILNDDPQMFVAENQTWQWVAGGFWGYYNGLWADPSLTNLGWFALPMGSIVNMTYQNSSMVNYFILRGDVPSNFETTISGLHWTARNYSANVVLYDYIWLADGRLEHGIWRNWTNNAILFEAVFVEPPSVTLNSPWEYSTVAANDLINCSIVASGETALQTVKYFWSSSETAPDWSTQGMVVSDPAKIPVPAGLENLAYLHVQAIDVLGQETRDVFQFRIGGGISSAPLLLVGIAVLAGVFFLTRRHSRRVQFS